MAFTDVPKETREHLWNKFELTLACRFTENLCCNTNISDPVLTGSLLARKMMERYSDTIKRDIEDALKSASDNIIRQAADLLQQRMKADPAKPPGTTGGP